MAQESLTLLGQTTCPPRIPDRPDMTVCSAEGQMFLTERVYRGSIEWPQNERQNSSLFICDNGISKNQRAKVHQCWANKQAHDRVITDLTSATKAYQKDR